MMSYVAHYRVGLPPHLERGVVNENRNLHGISMTVLLLSFAQTTFHDFKSGQLHEEPRRPCTLSCSCQNLIRAWISGRCLGGRTRRMHLVPSPSI